MLMSGGKKKGRRIDLSSILFCANAKNHSSDLLLFVLFG